MRPPGKTHMPPAKSSAVLRRINSVSSPPSASRATITVAAGIGGTGAREGPERAGGLDGPDDVVSRTGRGYDLHAQAISVRAPDVLRHVVTDVLRLVVGSRAQACTSELGRSEADGGRSTGQRALARRGWRAASPRPTGIVAPRVGARPDPQPGDRRPLSARPTNRPIGRESAIQASTSTRIVMRQTSPAVRTAQSEPVPSRASPPVEPRRSRVASTGNVPELACRGEL